MPLTMAREVLDFIEFLESRSTQPEPEEQITLNRKEWESLQEILYISQNASLMKQITQSVKTFKQGRGYIPPLEKLDVLD
jgi:antitoxin YefM